MKPLGALGHGRSHRRLTHPYLPRHRQRARCLSSSTDPFVIVGGGPSGLFMSILLSQYHVPNVLLEQQTPQSRFRHPQAHFLNTRTMELLKNHLPTKVYQELLTAMPPVDHWKYFRFTHSMSDEPLAQVLHPVDRPLQANVDANGILVEDDTSKTLQKGASVDQCMSPCSVGHLAQHTFCKILHRLSISQELSDVRYGTSVTSVQEDPATQRLKVVCNDGSIFTSPIVIAADGAQSTLRSASDIPWRGKHGLQHLMNIHVTLEPEQAMKLHQNNNHAMLYSVFNQHVVAMVVCHSLGDYIIQIPFFPPYQTVDQDFSSDNIERIVRSIFGNRVQSWTVQSAKPWIMSSMIAQRYYAEGVVLVGDAAHVFPPAGGFGMNTGLQDVHNLAWKLAQYYHSAGSVSLEKVLQSYQKDRQPVAQQNAALSVRNYQRLLQVTESCYLNEKHPNFLMRLLDSSPLPLTGKQALFRTLFQAALLPLKMLGSSPDSLYSKHIRSNLRKVLRGGAGLPLLFPRHELGFKYGGPSPTQHWKQDTIPVAPEMCVGGLVPHGEAVVLSDATTFPNLQFIRPNVISTSNLPAQVTRTARPTFVLLAIGSHDKSLIMQQRQRLSSRGIAVEIVWLGGVTNELDPDCLSLHENDGSGAAFTFRDEPPCVVLIRPDSHVCGIYKHSQDVECLMDDALASFQAL